MKFLYTFLILINFYRSTTLACKGCLSLDEHSFRKVIPKFKASLIKFDIAYPYGEKHDTFVKFADEHTANDDFIIGEVGIKEYGDKDNEEFAKSFRIDGAKLPQVRLFLSSTENPIVFNDEMSVENLRRFVMSNTDMHLVLPGCLEQFDKLLMKFRTSNDKKEIIKKGEALAKSLTDAEAGIAKNYLTYMKKVLENGMKFVKAEISRLEKIIKDGKITEKKKEDLSKKVNILLSFKGNKDEL